MYNKIYNLFIYSMCNINVIYIIVIFIFCLPLSFLCAICFLHATFQAPDHQNPVPPFLDLTTPPGSVPGGSTAVGGPACSVSPAQLKVHTVGGYSLLMDVYVEQSRLLVNVCKRRVLAGASSHILKGCGFDPWLGHMRRQPIDNSLQSI